MHTTRPYRLYKHQIEQLEVIDTNRSRAISHAFKLVTDDESALIDAITQRLTEPVNEAKYARVSAYLPFKVAEAFDDLVARVRLSAEEVARIAVEAYIRRASSLKKASYESPEPLHPPAEG